MTWRKIYGLGSTITYGMLKGEQGYFEDSKTNVDEGGRKVNVKRAKRMFTCQSSVHGGVFQISRKCKFFSVF